MISGRDCHGCCSDVVQSERPIFDDFFQHLWPYIGNTTRQMLSSQMVAFVAYPHRPMILHSPTENSLGAKSQNLGGQFTDPNVKLGGHQTSFNKSIVTRAVTNLRRLIGTTALGHHGFNSGMKS
ncbi:hypothetical protein TNCV_597681 [Trichonephila clavipes]|nr:hypothetical protein TNCV_597681 [Trichonephila clavipes]